jgi:hypothetical protein
VRNVAELILSCAALMFSMVKAIARLSMVVQGFAHLKLPQV